MAIGHPDQTYISTLLAYNPQGSGQPVSTLSKALHEARFCSDRDNITGNKISGPTKHHDRWSAALVYMSMLDQMGEVFDLISQSPNTYANNHFLKSLDLFFNNGSEPINKALYALRCSFAHDFGLVNRNGKDPLLQHHFSVNGGMTTPLITLPPTNWDGNLNNQDNTNVTKVNLERLGDVVEEIYSSLTRLNQTNQLRIALQGGYAELNATYFQFEYFV